MPRYDHARILPADWRTVLAEERRLAEEAAARFAIEQRLSRQRREAALTALVALAIATVLITWSVMP